MRAITDAKVAEQVQLTDDQKAQVAKIEEEQRKEFTDLFTAGGGDREAARERMQEITKQTEEKLTAVLTDEQKTKLEELEGEPFEFPRREGRRNRDA